jgi:large subunit ribosomal protein L17
MRHRKAGSRLGRETKHRKALMKALALGLFKHNGIQTGLVKAKELRRFAEPIITLAKKDTVHNRRRAFALLRDDAVVAKLFTEIGPAFAQRPGGYTRILRMGVRVGDAADMARIELVGLGEVVKAD